jgi:hypothetical protein
MNESPRIIYRKSDNAPFVLQDNGRYKLDTMLWYGESHGETIMDHDLLSLSDPEFFSSEQTKKKFVRSLSDSLPKLPLVKFNFDDLPVEFHKQYPFTDKEVFVILGEIKQMPGHCIVLHHRTGQIHSGFHTDNFVEIPEDEA